MTEAYVELKDPVPGELRREPIPDADAPCPRCGHRGWLRVEKAAEPEWPFTRWKALACASCGASAGWTNGGRARPGRREKPRPHEAAHPEPAFPVYGLAGEGRLRQWSSEQGTTTSVSLWFGELDVRSELRLNPEPHEEVARHRLFQHLWTQLPPPRGESYDARSLVLADHRRSATARARKAEPGELSVAIDGEPVTFVLARLPGEVWAAAAAHGDIDLVLCAPGDPPAGLALITTRLPDADRS